MDKITNFEYYHLFISQYENLLDDNEKLNIDYYGKFEHLQEDFKIILNNIGITEIKHDDNKMHASNDKRHYSEFYTPEILEFINDLMSEDFSNFNYEMVDNVDDLKNINYEVADYNKNILYILIITVFILLIILSFIAKKMI
jgi:hypothetical protein